MLSATYLAWAVGPMLQLDSVSVSDAASGTSGVFSLRLQNNGLGDFVGSHKACIVPPAGVSAELAPGRAGSWRASANVLTLLGSPSQRCFSLPGLPARTHSTLPPIKLEWAGGLKTLDLDLRVEQSAAAGGEVQLVTVAVRVLLSAATLTSCDELCICKSSDLTRFTMSHECRAQLPPGSHCRLAKPSHAGANWASGVVDEYFAYKATAYASGGVCQMESTHRDTLLGVYKACTRFGAQEPVGFANSEGSSHASVTFPCEAGATYYLFWNAEYAPSPNPNPKPDPDPNPNPNPTPRPDPNPHPNQVRARPLLLQHQRALHRLDLRARAPAPAAAARQEEAEGQAPVERVLAARGSVHRHEEPVQCRGRLPSPPPR